MVPAVQFEGSTHVAQILACNQMLQNGLFYLTLLSCHKCLRIYACVHRLCPTYASMYIYEYA